MSFPPVPVYLSEDLSNRHEFLDHAPFATIKLVVERRPRATKPAQNLVWIITWDVGEPATHVKRILQLGKTEGKEPICKVSTQAVSLDGCDTVDLGILSCDQRGRLVMIATQTTTMTGWKPSTRGEWVQRVLEGAVAANLLAKTVVDNAMFAVKARDW